MAYAALSTRNTSGLHPSLRGMGFLGDSSTAITPHDALQQAIHESAGLNLNPKDFQNPAWLSSAESQIAAAQFNIGSYSAQCAGQTAPPMNLLSTASGIGLSTTAATTGILSAAHLIPAAAVPVVGWVIAGVGALVGMISAIFQHHAQAVKRDLTFGCAALPAVNNAFSVIGQAVQSGQARPSDAAASLDEIYSQFQAHGGAAINTHPFCNSNCEMGVILKAMVIYWKARYASMAANAASATAAQNTATQTQIAQLTQQASAAQASGDTTTANALLSQANTLQQSISPSASIPSWAWIVGAVALVWSFA